MPKLTGFELLEVLEHQPEVIFTTAYDQFAIRAFERNAVDYLLKPFSKARFKEAITKLSSRLKTKEGIEKGESGIEKIRQHFAESEEKLHRVVIKKSGKIHVISTDDINFLEAQDDYVMIYTLQSKHLKQKTMKFFEAHLPVEDFVRIHRSYIVKLSEIAQMQLYEKESYIVILKNGVKLPVSKSGLPKLKKKLDF